MVGGAAGLGAAVCGVVEGLRTVLVDAEATGGQSGRGWPLNSSLPGGRRAARLRPGEATTQARRFGAEMLLTSDVASLDVCGSARVVGLANGSQLSAHSVLLATGVAYRRLAVPGIDAFTGSVATTTALLRPRRNPVLATTSYIVGGANSAGQAAVFFSRFARQVTIMVRARTSSVRCPTT